MAIVVVRYFKSNQLYVPQWLTSLDNLLQISAGVWNNLLFKGPSKMADCQNIFNPLINSDYQTADQLAVKYSGFEDQILSYDFT